MRLCFICVREAKGRSGAVSAYSATFAYSAVRSDIQPLTGEANHSLRLHLSFCIHKNEEIDGNFEMRFLSSVKQTFLEISLLKSGCECESKSTTVLPPSL